VARFVRLTRADLAQLTRGELLDRIEAEQAYWHRKQDRGQFTDADRAALAEFHEIMHAAVDPAAATRDLSALVTGVPGAGTYWDEVPEPAGPAPAPKPSVPAKTSRLQRAAAAWPGEPAGPGASVAVIRRDQRQVALAYRLDVDEHARREAVGQAPITQLWQADALLNLPADLPVPLESLTDRERRELHRLPDGAVQRDGMNVIRRARPPLTATFALVSVQHWRTGLSAAGEYAPYCRRAFLLPAAPAEEEALLEASYYGIGVGLADRTGVRELMVPGPYKQMRVTPAQWTFTEQVYAQLPTGTAA
jgi:hypothetical protein